MTASTDAIASFRQDVVSLCAWGIGNVARLPADVAKTRTNGRET
jgi:hypothetical protein